MSISQDFSGSRRSAGKSPEKSNFAQTCNLLSQYIKERGCLRDISLEIAGKFEPKGKPVEISKQPLKSMFHHTIEDAINKPNSSKSATMEPETAQMTIFYGGQVLVFDDFPENKAKEVMLWASNGSSSRVASGSNIALPNSGSTHHTQSQSQANSSDMPIARRSSLHRFLEKRKDRVTARAPYQLDNPSSEFPKHEEQLQLKL